MVSGECLVRSFGGLAWGRQDEELVSSRKGKVGRSLRIEKYRYHV